MLGCADPGARTPIGASGYLNHRLRFMFSCLINDWDSKFEEHKRIMEEERRVREDRIQRAEKLETGWELARLCKEIIKESNNTLRVEKRARKEAIEEKRREEERKRIAMVKKIAEKKKQIDRTLDRILYMERKRQSDIEQKERRMELREMKSNLWK